MKFLTSWISLPDQRLESIQLVHGGKGIGEDDGGRDIYVGETISNCGVGDDTTTAGSVSSGDGNATSI